MQAQTKLDDGTDIEAPENIVIVTNSSDEQDHEESDAKVIASRLKREEYTQRIDPAK